MIKGSDYVGVVPRHIQPVYCHSLFPEQDGIYDFINPWYNAEEIIDGVEWSDIDVF